MIPLLLAMSLAGRPAFAARCTAALAEATHASPVRARALLASLRPPDLASGPGALPSLDAAIDELDARPDADTQRAALTTLDALCAQARVPEVAPAPIDRKALTQILSDPRFAQRTARRSGISELVARLWDVLKELLQQRVVKGYSSVARAVFLAAVLLAMLALARAVFRRRREEGAAIGPGDALAPTITRDPSLDALLEGADQALSRGDLREAVRGHMRAALRVLVGRGLADPSGAHTNREVTEALEALGTAPDTAALMRDLTAQFDAFIYGEARLQADDAEQFIRVASRLRERADPT